jgi:antitoxin component HigA of HigAB toxin-antitoxin module
MLRSFFRSSGRSQPTRYTPLLGDLEAGDGALAAPAAPHPNDPVVTTNNDSDKRHPVLHQARSVVSEHARKLLREFPVELKIFISYIASLRALPEDLLMHIASFLPERDIQGELNPTKQAGVNHFERWQLGYKIRIQNVSDFAGLDPEDQAAHLQYLSPSQPPMRESSFNPPYSVFLIKPEDEEKNDTRYIGYPVQDPVTNLYPNNKDTFQFKFQFQCEPINDPQLRTALGEVEKFVNEQPLQTIIEEVKKFITRQTLQPVQENIDSPIKERGKALDDTMKEIKSLLLQYGLLPAEDAIKKCLEQYRLQLAQKKESEITVTEDKELEIEIEKLIKDIIDPKLLKLKESVTQFLSLSYRNRLYQLRELLPPFTPGRYSSQANFLKMMNIPLEHKDTKEKFLSAAMKLRNQKTELCRQNKRSITKSITVIALLVLLTIYINKIISLFEPTTRDVLLPQLTNLLDAGEFTFNSRPYSCTTEEQLLSDLDNSDTLSPLKFAFSSLCLNINSCLVPETPQATELLSAAKETCRLYTIVSLTTPSIVSTVALLVIVYLWIKLSKGVSSNLLEGFYNEENLGRRFTEATLEEIDEELDVLSSVEATPPEATIELETSEPLTGARPAI